MYSYGPPHMAEQKQDDQLEHRGKYHYYTPMYPNEYLWMFSPNIIGCWRNMNNQDEDTRLGILVYNNDIFLYYWSFFIEEIQENSFY